MKKKSIGKLNSVIYFEECVENSYSKDSLGGYTTYWIPAFGESDTAEATTSTTNIKMTTHGMSNGDYIINTSRSNNIKSITKVDDNNVTVAAITGQTTGDTITKRMYSYSKAWANITPKSVNSFMEEQKKVSRTTHTVEIRYRSGITTKLRIKYGTRYFEILSLIDIDEGSQRMKLECRELIS